MSSPWVTFAPRDRSTTPQPASGLGSDADCAEDPWLPRQPAYNHGGNARCAEAAWQSSGRESATQGTRTLRSPCPRQPHCANWRKHEDDAKLTVAKKMQYLYLYAAEARCITCMQCYVETLDVDPRCTSCGKNAREWSSKLSRLLPQEIKDFFHRHGL